jgi:DNA replication and repair protein RecF
MIFYFDGKESRYFCSQGQQRALILGLKLTQILYHHRIYGYYPILILDDVLSELDREKRAYLIRFLNKNNAQTFLTSTDMEQHQELHNLDLTQFRVKNGTVVKG